MKAGFMNVSADVLRSARPRLILRVRTDGHRTFDMDPHIHQEF